eukprot:362952-Chlamydomonas_euryale.AAC.6
MSMPPRMLNGLMYEPRPSMQHVCPAVTHACPAVTHARRAVTHARTPSRSWMAVTPACVACRARLPPEHAGGMAHPPASPHAPVAAAPAQG